MSVIQFTKPTLTKRIKRMIRKLIKNGKVDEIKQVDDVYYDPKQFRRGPKP